MQYHQIFISSADPVADAVTASSACVTVRQDATERIASTNARASHMAQDASIDAYAIAIAVVAVTSQPASAFVIRDLPDQSVWIAVQQVSGDLFYLVPQQP